MKNLIVFLVLFCLFATSIAQIRIKAKPGEIYHLNEVGAVLLLKDDQVKVEFVMPADKRAKAYMDVDIQIADEILMVNGQKIKMPQDIEKIYQDLDTGEEFKIGIRRDGDLMIVSYKKADPADLPERKMMRMKVTDDGTGSKKSIVDEEGNEHVIEGDSVTINGRKMSTREFKQNQLKIEIDDNDDE